jgi:hypothetical protein
MVFGSLADVFFQWEYIGVFDYILPFLLIFVIVYGILQSTRFFGDNKPVYIVIALVVGLMSLRYQYFLSDFLSELFPRLGIGLAIILGLLLLVGIFIADTDHYWRYILMAVGAVIAIVIFWQVADRMGWYWLGNIGSDSVGFILLGVILIGLIVAVVASGSRTTHSGPVHWPRFPGGRN